VSPIQAPSGAAQTVASETPAAEPDAEKDAGGEYRIDIIGDRGEEAGNDQKCRQRQDCPAPVDLAGADDDAGSGDCGAHRGGGARLAGDAGADAEISRERGQQADGKEFGGDEAEHAQSQ